MHFKTIDAYVYANEQLGPCFYALVVQLWNYAKTNIRLKLSKYCRMIPSTSSRGLFDNIHLAIGE